MSKVIATYTGKFYIYGRVNNIKIEILCVPKKKNKIVITGHYGGKTINGSLLALKKLKTGENIMSTAKNMYAGLQIRFQNRGSYQSDKMHSFSDTIAIFSKDEMSIDKLSKFLEKYITQKKVRRTKRKSKRGKKGGGSVKKRTIKKSKKKTDGNSAYFEYKSILGSSNKFWRIVKNGSKITTHYGKIGTLGQMTTKDYGTKVDSEYDKLIKSKKKKGYVESMDFGDKKPKPPTKIQREYMKICNKAENDSKLNPGRRNFDCEAMLTTGPSLAPQVDSELKWFTEWHKDALKNKDYDWSKYDEHHKSKRKKKSKKVVAPVQIY